jgi:hypothetical protein
MDVLPVDLHAVLGIVMGSLVVLIPVAGLTARFALKPVVEAIARARGQSSPEEVRLLRQQVALLEQQVQGLEGTVRRLGEEEEFRRQIEAPHR